MQRRTVTRSKPRPRDVADHRAGLHICLGHGQDQLDRPDSKNSERVADRVRHRLPPDDDAAVSDRHICLSKGVGIWGINIPVGWGFAIINFVWWIGIGHAGTLISAILLLLRQEWRTSINRFAEAMTLVRCCVRGTLSIASSGAPMVCLLARSISEHDGNVAAVSQPARLGRVCCFDVCDGFFSVLVCRLDSRSGNFA